MLNSTMQNFTSLLSNKATATFVDQCYRVCANDEKLSNEREQLAQIAFGEANGDAECLLLSAMNLSLRDTVRLMIACSPQTKRRKEMLEKHFPSLMFEKRITPQQMDPTIAVDTVERRSKTEGPDLSKPWSKPVSTAVVKVLWAANCDKHKFETSYTAPVIMIAHPRCMSTAGLTLYCTSF